MMISTRGRYALRVMIDLAERQTEGYIPLKEIAQREEISEKYLESILKLLVKGNILVGLRGKGGGYRMMRPPEQCTVGSILRLTESSLAPVSCLEQSPIQCERAGECRTLPMWKKLDALIREFFDGVTIADLAQPTDPGSNFVI